MAPPFDSLFPDHDLQLCGPRSLPPSQKSNRRTVRPLTFPYSASSRPIPRRKNSFTTTLSRPKLLISTNITHPPKERKLSPNYSLDLPHPFVKKNYELSSLDKTPSWIYHTITVHSTSNLSFSRRGHVSSCCKINSTPATDSVNKIAATTPFFETVRTRHL